jgi:hypothetical protein
MKKSQGKVSPVYVAPCDGLGHVCPCCGQLVALGAPSFIEAVAETERYWQYFHWECVFRNPGVRARFNKFGLAIYENQYWLESFNARAAWAPSR